MHEFSGRIKCGQCGSWYGPKVWHSTDKYRRVIWQCNHKFDGEKKCSTPHLTDEELQARFLRALNRLIADRADIIRTFSEMVKETPDIAALEAERTEWEKIRNDVSREMKWHIRENARTVLNQAEYRAKYDELARRFEEADGKVHAIQTQIAEGMARKAAIEDFLKELHGMDSVVTEFDPEMFCRLADFMTVYSKDDVRVTFRNGMEVKA